MGVTFDIIHLFCVNGSVTFGFGYHSVDFVLSEFRSLGFLGCSPFVSIWRSLGLFFYWVIIVMADSVPS